MMMWNAWFEFFMTLFASPAHAVRQGRGPAGKLLEGADACAGRDPRRAADLRAAAVTYLGVVR